MRNFIHTSTQLMVVGVLTIMVIGQATATADSIKNRYFSN